VKRGVTPEFVNMSKEIFLYPKFRVLQQETQRTRARAWRWLKGEVGSAVEEKGQRGRGLSGLRGKIRPKRRFGVFFSFLFLLFLFSCFQNLIFEFKFVTEIKCINKVLA
jgi:hypothetical protein